MCIQKKKKKKKKAVIPQESLLLWCLYAGIVLCHSRCVQRPTKLRAAWFCLLLSSVKFSLLSSTFAALTLRVCSSIRRFFCRFCRFFDTLNLHVDHSRFLKVNDRSLPHLRYALLWTQIQPTRTETLQISDCSRRQWCQRIQHACAPGEALPGD